MEEVEYTDKEIVHKILKFVSESASFNVSEAVCTKKFNYLCEVFANKFENITKKFLVDPTCWEHCQVVLLYLTLLQKIATFLVQECGSHLPNLKPSADAILSEKNSKYLYSLSTTHEKLVRFAAQGVIACLACEVSHHRHLDVYFDCLVKVLFGLIDKASLENELWHWKIDILTALLKQFKKSEKDLPELVLSEIVHFFNKYLQTIHSDDIEGRFFSTLCFYQEIMEMKTDSQELLITIYKNFSLLIRNFRLHLLSPLHRQLYIKVLGSLNCYPPRLEHSVMCVDSARLYCETICLCAKQLEGFFQCHAQFIGFGGRYIQKSTSCDSRVSVGFSKIERMLILNGALNIICILIHDTATGFSVQPLELIMKDLISSAVPSPTNLDEKIIDIYIEQDDALIEMLLLHLTICISSKLAGSTFLISPHALFVELLRHVSFDSSVLLDWLTSNETQFLLYLLKYLKYLAISFSEFCLHCDSSANSTPLFSSVISTLKHLKCSIEKLCSRNLFPFPVKPLLKVMLSVETLANQK